MGICLSQQKYALDLLTETGMLACKLVDTPIEMNHKLGGSDTNGQRILSTVSWETDIFITYKTRHSLCSKCG